MTDCDASVGALQSAVLFGLMDIAAVSFVLGGERISFRALDGLVSVDRLGCFIFRQEFHTIPFCYGAENGGRCDGQRSALRWLMQRTAMADAAPCVFRGCLQKQPQDVLMRELPVAVVVCRNVLTGYQRSTSALTLLK